VLFGVVFLWQIPHFLSIAWLLRQDYAKAGFRMLPVVDPTGKRTARHLLVTGALLVPVSALPAVIGMAGVWYLAGALALSLLYLAVSIRLARKPETLTARAVFLVSLAYLPALLAILMIDKLPA
jgi:protoheme IX farnesyltransferase